MISLNIIFRTINRKLLWCNSECSPHSAPFAVYSASSFCSSFSISSLYSSSSSSASLRWSRDYPSTSSWNTRPNSRLHWIGFNMSFRSLAEYTVSSYWKDDCNAINQKKSPDPRASYCLAYRASRPSLSTSFAFFQAIPLARFDYSPACWLPEVLNRPVEGHSPESKYNGRLCSFRSVNTRRALYVCA